MQKSADTYKPIQNLESKQLMAELVRTPLKFREHLERYAISVAVVITYGRRVHDIYRDEVVCLNRQTNNFLTSIKCVYIFSRSHNFHQQSWISIPGAYLVESIPALLYLPSFLTPWRTAALTQRARDIEYLTRLVDEVKTKVQNGRAAPSFCRQLLEDREKNEMTELEIAYTCGKYLPPRIPFCLANKSYSDPFWCRRRNHCWESILVHARVCRVRPVFHPQGPERAGRRRWQRSHAGL